MEKRLRILMMIHRQADNSPYCFYVHEQAKALTARGHEVVVISAVGVTPMMGMLRPAQAEVARRTPKQKPAVFATSIISLSYPSAHRFGA